MDWKVIRIGTSGWHYKHWIGKLYPADLATGQMLSVYAKHFDTVELNNTFYRLPDPGSVQKWYQTVPENFCFAIKASRYLTHLKRLKDPREGLQKFFSVISVLREKTGPVLFQLPPRFKVNPERLKEFLNALPSGYRYAFEFRDSSWEQETVYNILRQHRIACCITNRYAMDSPLVFTSEFTYIRMHGGYPEDHGNYRHNLLEEWAEKIRQFPNKVKEIYLYFNNDREGYAVKNALDLIALLRNDRVNR